MAMEVPGPAWPIALEPWQHILTESCYAVKQNLYPHG